MLSRKVIEHNFTNDVAESWFFQPILGDTYYRN